MYSSEYTECEFYYCKHILNDLNFCQFIKSGLPSGNCGRLSHTSPNMVIYTMYVKNTKWSLGKLEEMSKMWYSDVTSTQWRLFCNSTVYSREFWINHKENTKLRITGWPWRIEHYRDTYPMCCTKFRFNSLRPSDAYMRSKLTIIGSDNGLSPARRQAIIWTNAGILLIGSLGTNFSEISIGIQTFSFKKMHLKM